MKKIIDNIGDRYQSKENPDFIVELVSDGWLIVDNTISQHHTPIGEIVSLLNIDVNRRHYKYLGNFGKSNKFKQIYDILNSTELS
jgi:hypothetical protein